MEEWSSVGLGGAVGETLERHLYTMKSKASVAEEAFVALLPSVTLTFQKPACQGFGDSLSRSRAGPPNPNTICN